MLSTLLKSAKRRSHNHEEADSPSELQLLLNRVKVFAEQGNRCALEDLQRLVLRPLQSLHMLDAYLKADHQALGSFEMWNDFGLNFIPSKGQSFIDIIHDDRQIPEKNLPIAKLGRDSVLPTCWHPSSIIHALGNIGKSRRNGDWRQDPNHLLIWWYPLNIFWVGGGNHSITQGIILAEGEIKPKEGYDLSDLYQYIQFDGTQWLDRHSGKKLGTPRYKELGYVFEIGRFISAMD